MNISAQKHLNDAELQKVLFDWNATQTDYPHDKYLHQLVEEQVERTPNAIALIFNQQHLTYRELNNRANQIAHYLQRLKIGNESLVGVCMNRTPDMIMVMLGILKAGGAYVALDPVYPKARLIFAIEDAAVSVLLTQTDLVSDLPITKAQLVCIDDLVTILDECDTSNPIVPFDQHNLAYILYTSGSTGHPKGVAIEHRSVVAFISWAHSIFSAEELAGVLAATSICFDLSVFEIFVTLGKGGTLILAENALALITLEARDQVTLINTVPSAISALVDMNGIPANVQVVNLAGEALANKLVQAVYALGTVNKIYNLYGPSEDTTYSTFVLTTKGASTNPTIGRPISNTKTYILDEQGETTALGVAGELCLGGDGLARGYHNRPELTAEKFIPNPFAEGRLYRTGDLARYLPNGEIEYMGRIDNQVKLRGFRIELGEIEATLMEQSTVKQAVVLVHEDKFGDKQLVSYIVANPESMTEAQSDDAKDYVSLWQSVYDETYRKASAVTTKDLTFNISGWNSSYTNKPIPEAEMREWVEQTVAKILSFNPQNVLELGCGTGLLLSRIAPHCEHYVGTDISATGLEHIRTVQKTIGGLENITLLERAADDTHDFADGSFDTIVINSVIQHFPDVAYLLKVLQGAARLIKEGGRIFIGDVPSFLHRETFHASVSTYQAQDNDTVEKVWQRIRQQMDAEKDLQFAPAFFLALAHHIPELSHVQVQPKLGYSHNQLTLFRQDVILHFGSSESTTQDLNWIDWQDLTQTQQQLNERPSVLAMRNIPNARLSSDVCALNWLHEANPQTTITQCRDYVAKHTIAGVEPEDVRQLAQQLGYRVELSWLNSDVNGNYDAVFTRDDLPQKFATFTTVTPSRILTTYANNPQHTKLNRQLIPQLRSALQARLPEYMVPAIFTLVDEMPLSPSGKIDRKVLAELPVDFDFVREEFLVEAHNPFEKLLADVWADVLDLTHIGVEDNFFALGGNSLKAMMVAGRLQRLFGRDIPALGVFTASTISSFAMYLLDLYPDLAINSAPASTEEREEGEI